MRQAPSRGSEADEGNAVLGGSGDRRTMLPALCARPYLKKCGGTSASQCEAGAGQYLLSMGRALEGRRIW